MLKSVMAFLASKSSANALAIIKLLIGSLSPVHRTELLTALAILHDADEVVESVVTTVQKDLGKE